MTKKWRDEFIKTVNKKVLDIYSKSQSFLSSSSEKVFILTIRATFSESDTFDETELMLKKIASQMFMKRSDEALWQRMILWKRIAGDSKNRKLMASYLWQSMTRQSSSSQ